MCLALANMNCRGSSCELHGWFDSCTAMVGSKPRQCWAEVMTFFGVSHFLRVRVEQGSLFPTPLLAHMGLGILSSGGPASSPKLYPWSRMLPLSGECHWFVQPRGQEGDTDHPTGSGGDLRAPKPVPLPSLGILMHLCAVGAVWGNSSANPQCSEWCCLYGVWGEIMLN